MSISSWNIDPTHSHAEFKVRHLMISNVKGSFPKVSGVLTLDESDVTKSSVEATIDVASVETRDAQRDAHLKSADFFDVEKFPVMTFQSTKVVQGSAGEGTVEGDLTIRDVTKAVVFEVTGPTAQTKDPWGNLRVGVEATTKISRKEFGLTWSAPLEAGGVMVGDEVTITLEIEFVKAA
ncbi:MAG: YceI family protein [Acidobacteriota bacterium]|nr:YceI family protein [Acidobacteriota bacterium]